MPYIQFAAVQTLTPACLEYICLREEKKKKSLQQMGYYSKQYYKRWPGCDGKTVTLLRSNAHFAHPASRVITLAVQLQIKLLTAAKRQLQPS